MSPIAHFELAETRRDAKAFERRYRDFERQLTNLNILYRGARNNDHPLVSRNKREGRYLQRIKK